MRYTLSNVIGRGSTAEIFCVKLDSHHGKAVAMKCQRITQQALDEAKVMRKQAAHPSIIEFFDAFYIRETESVCIVMELATTDLRKILRDTSCDSRKLADLKSKIPVWSAQLALALEHLHFQGIAHRDIKPANILLLQDGRIVLGDLGVHKTKVKMLRGMSTMVGTPSYLAPEVMLGSEYGLKSDIWSFGCVLFDLAFAECMEHNPLCRTQDRLNLKSAKEGEYSSLLKSCLRRNPERRASISSSLKSSPLLGQGIVVLVTKIWERSFQVSQVLGDQLFSQLKRLGMTHLAFAATKLQKKE